MSQSSQEAATARYKALKEDFVSNLTGGTISEINYVTAVAPVAVILWSILQSRHGLFNSPNVWTITTDFLINVVAILLATTLYAFNPLLLSILLLAPACLLLLLPPLAKPQKKTNLKSLKRAGLQHEVVSPTDPRYRLPKRPFLTMYRGSMLVITSLSILSVDFRIFPRRFAKVENWGTSLMDVGVGSFVFSAGIVAMRSIILSENQQAGLFRRLLKSGRHSLPLLVLGLLRLWSVKELDYAEHVSEYGVHWNFFFTLGLLPPFVTLFQSAFRYLPSYAGLAVVLATAYQLALEYTNLKAYILVAPRVDILSMNREGIFSFIGYLAIFLAGQGTGLFVLPRHLLPTNTSGWQQRKQLLLKLISWSIFWVVLFIFSTNRVYGLNLQVSRRLANLPYFFWIAAFNSCQLTVFCLVETLLFPDVWKSMNCLSKTEEEELYRGATSRILDAFNRNGLFVFLVANLLTGAVNLSISTLQCGHKLAFSILVVYGALVTSVALFLDRLDVSVKI
ncbi:Bgt-2379 [Blumeria graminis f. sp. tritici]|uniref:GPI-anchored wall transfer protein n=2 Tax=Blumeria graminis f. sp. tritici TaxID=62690 RepID=E7DZJ9_BLUGR|nr:acyltransferase activity [Blumeria graminis f. sp. tritici]EPQ62989.1 hypothetical protein BGT96224_2379 [Blumeria graminis f. sp. tritici 96224]VDB91347.1 Bgt-2379 [Blumeria graminis f. sp. tritici]